MRAVIKGRDDGLLDLPDFIQRARADKLASSSGAPLFDRNRAVSVARAPGRLDLMGGIADYSGSLVLQWPLREATIAAVQRDQTETLRIESSIQPVPSIAGMAGSERTRSVTFEIDLAALCKPDGSPVSYADARRLLTASAQDRWAAYGVGVFIVLMRERGARFDGGARIYIESSVPEGKGVSSSAALEVAVMTAVADAFDVKATPDEIATLCQVVENHVVGAACGIMDQMAVSCGEPGRLLALECQPATLLDPVALPPELGVWGIDSGVRHAVTGSSYTDVRVGAAMGYRIIAELAGLPVEQTHDRHVLIVDNRWRGYLANITPAEYEAQFRDGVPDAMTGEDFLRLFGGVADPVVTVDPDTVYAVRTPTAHPIYENARVRTFADLLKNEARPANAAVQLGRLMGESHQSYSACGLGSEATDLLVDLVGDVARRSQRSLFGAKITGGGSGGTVAVLGAHDAGAAIEEVALRFTDRTGHAPHIFSGSSPGAGVVGAVRLGAA